MKKKVLFALMALFSFVGAWANVAVTVGGYTVTLDKKWMVAEEDVPQVVTVVKDEATIEFTVVGVCNEDKNLVDVDDFDEDDVANLYLKVFADGNYLFVPFKLVKVADASLYDIVADKASWDASQENGGLKLYHEAYPGADYGWWHEGWDEDTWNKPDEYNYHFTKWWNPAAAPVSVEPNPDDYENEEVYQAAREKYDWERRFVGPNWINALNSIDRSWLNRTADQNAVQLKIESEDADAADYQALYDLNECRMSNTFREAGYPWVVFYCDENEENAHTFGFYYKKGNVEAYDDVSGYSISNEKRFLTMAVPGLFANLGYPLELIYDGTDPHPWTLWTDENGNARNWSDEYVIEDSKITSFKNTTIYELPVGDLDASVQAVTVTNWTRNPASATYVGEGIEPIVKVDGADLDDTPYTVQYTWNDPADSSEDPVVVDAPVHAGTYTMTLGIEGEDGNFVPVSDAKRTFTVNKNTLEIVLQQIYMPYGSAISDLEPVYVLKKAAEDITPTDQIVVTDLGTVAKGTGWSVDDNDQPEPNSVKNYTTLGQPKAFVGRTYKQAMVEIVPEQADPQAGDAPAAAPEYEPAYDENGDPIYTDEVDFAGYEDYIASTNTSSANIVAIKGILTVTVDAESFTKVYGDDDPDYNEMDATTNLPKYFTAKNQAGNDVTGITIYRPDYRKTLADSDEIDPATEAVGEHELAVDLGEEADHYDAVIVYAENEDEKTPVLTITPFDISEDYAKDAVLAKNAVYSFTSYGDANGQTEYATGTVEVTGITGDKATITVLTNSVDGFEGNVYTIDATDPTNDSKLRQLYDGDAAQDIWVTVALESAAVEAQDAYEEKFVIAMPQVTYNADTQYPDPTITFKHDVLGVINLTYQADGTTPLKPFVGKGKTYTTDSYWYKKTVKGGGDYKSNQAVKRDATAPTTILAGATITVHAVESDLEATPAVRKNFTGAKSQKWTINPAPLAVKAKDNVDMIYAGPTPNFGVELNGENAIFAKETAANQTTILTNLGNAIWKYAPNDEYGYDGYDGGITDKTADPVVPYTISVKEAAQTAVNVILAARNYAVTYTEGESTVVPVELGFIVRNQSFDYNTDGTNAAVYTYNRPAINTTVSLDPESPEGDIVPGTVELAVGTVLPEGVSINDLFSAIAFKDNKEITAASADAYEKVLTLTKTEAANNPGYDITITNGNWTVTPLTDMHLDYANVGQALQDHQGLKMSNVYMPARNLKNKNWYTMVLPFDINAEDFFASNALQYGAFEVMDVENNTKDVHFKLTIETIPANTPFILKVVHDYDKNRDAANALCNIVFNRQYREEGVTIAALPADKDWAYNVLEKSPYSEDKKGNKFIGQYTGKTGLADTERYMSKGEFYKGYPDPAPEGKTPTELAPTVAYLQFPSVAAAADARVYVEEPGGVTTAINGVGVAEDDDVEIAAGSAAQGWYTITGIKLDAKPTTSGIYIFNGKKVAIQ